MASITLDRTRHYSQIYGTTENGAVFSQDGIDFRGDGTAILSDDAQDTVLAINSALAEQVAAEQVAAPKPKRGKQSVQAEPQDDEDLA